MAALREFTEDVEVYPTDEAFVELRGCRWTGTLRNLGCDIKAKVLKWAGVPVTPHR